MVDCIHADTRLGEVTLKVSNLERSIRFYEDVVGLKVLTRTSHTVSLTADGKNTLVVLEQIPDAVVIPPRSTTGLYHFALLLPNRTALGLSLKNLIHHGIQIGQADHLVSEALYISDLDHNGIEIYADRPRESWTRDANGYYVMTTGPLDWDGLLEEAENKEWAGLPPETTIGHIHLHVGDLHKARQFYCDILGFELTADAASWGALFIAAGGYHHHIGMNIWAGAGAPAPPPNGTGLKQYTIVLPSDVELKNTLDRVQSAGIAVREHRGVSLVTDPFSHTIRLTSGST